MADNDSFIGGIFASLNESDLKDQPGAPVVESSGRREVIALIGRLVGFLPAFNASCPQSKELCRTGLRGEPRPKKGTEKCSLIEEKTEFSWSTITVNRQNTSVHLQLIRL